MKSPRFTILAFGFAALLVLPMMDQVLGLSSSFKSTENRRIDGPPALHFPHVNTFIRQFDQYYKENFGWRNALFFVYSRWKYRLLGESPLPEKVVVGKQGWHYLGNSYNNVIDQHRNLYPLSPDSARIITDNLLRYQRELASQGIKFYVLIAPDSHTIYPEYLSRRAKAITQAIPAWMCLSSISPRTPIYHSLIFGIRFGPPSNSMSFITRPIRTGMIYGTLIGCAALLNRIRQDVPTLPPVQLSNYQITQMRGAGGDLVQMLTLQNEVKDSVFYEIKPSAQVSARQIATVPNAEYGFPSLRFTSADTSKPKLLFIGDSFSHSMTQFLPGYFRESYFVRSSHLDPALLKIGEARCGRY